ncbi:MAG: hypothetical protein ACKO7W_10590 [Elainella sp.]
MNFTRFLYSPMVMMSLLLHGLFLMAPLPPKPEAKPEPPEPKEEEVQLSSISSLKIAPKPSPAVAPSPRPQVKKPPLIRPVAAARPLLPRPVVPTPVPSVAPSPVATPTPVAAAPSPVAPPSPSPLPSPTAPLSQGSLQSSAVAGVGQASAAQFYSSFPDPTAFFTPESLQAADTNLTDPIPVDGITNMTRLERVDLTQARDTYLPQMYPGATFAQVGTYGGGDVYEVRQANSVGYVVLLKEKSLSLASYIVEWNRNPNLPQSTAGVATP